MSKPENQHMDNALLKGHSAPFLAEALEATSDGIWVWHIPSGEAYFSPRYFTMLGYEVGELTPSYETWSRLVHPNDRDVTQRTLQRHLDNKSESFQIEFRMQTKFGDWLWILGRGKTVEWDEDGNPIRMVGSHVNIDTRKRAEQKLAEYREHLEAMVRERTLELEQTTSLLEATFNAIPDILGVQDDAHHMIRYNAAGYNFLGMTQDDVAGKRCFELIGRSRECDQCATSQCYKTKTPTSIIRYEKALDAWLDVRAYPILDDHGNLVRVIEHLRDITSEKKAEEENRRLHEQLQVAQKMEALGTLAGGIAHDFNNLLMGIQGRSSLMATDLEPSHPHQEHISAIEDYIRSATELTRQLLGFARGGKYEVKPTEINDLVLASSAMFGRTRKEIQIHTKVDDKPLVVEADKRQIEQVLLNLYINAWQAMPGSGELYLETKIEQVTDDRCKIHQIAPGDYAKISVTDTGIGMDEATMQRIFDPFFTTKEKGRGTGLGLASAYGIIRNHHGMILVQSQTGAGTTFDIFLPLSEKNVRQESHEETGPIQGEETILLVDDEEMIIEVGQAMLEKLGYRVVTARGGEAALAEIGKSNNHFDLVVLDLIMPGMDGGQVFDSIRKRRPDLPVMLSSGYAINGQAEDIMQRGCDGFIQKPFNITELSQKIRQILDAATS
jgi:two-component system cell cycle sensor histidine kinase/response regulator CckA